MGKSKNKYFVVWEGKIPGIYRSWEECKQQVNGYAKAIYKGFATEAEARKAMSSPCWDYIGKNAKTKKPTKEQIEKFGMPDFESLSVDAACSGNPGTMEYQGVYSRTGERVFHQGVFEDGTNNVGEFLALVHGLAFLKERKSPLPIYTDSKTALAWVRNKKVKSELERTEKNYILFDLIERAEKWLKTNEYSTEIKKWETAVWGEIPADFGRK